MKIIRTMISLRKTVSTQRDAVWRARDERDAYTHRSRAQIKEGEQNVDHVLEVQLLEHAALDLIKANREILDRVRAVVNDTENLNVTTKRVNQAKRGPFTAALNRLKKYEGGLREISVEQLARTGRARWMVDEGLWAHVEKETVISFDHISENLTRARMTRAQAALVDKVVESLHDTLEQIKII
jgi:hypothetical protein